MHRIISLFAAIAFTILFNVSASQEAEGSCTARDRADLARAGYAKADIQSLCEQDTGVPPPRFNILYGEGQTRWSQWCVTPQGSCPLNPLLGYYAVGAPCNCYMPWGFYGGVAQ
jgi:hypothetical protein